MLSDWLNEAHLECRRALCLQGNGHALSVPPSFSLSLTGEESAGNRDLLSLWCGHPCKHKARLHSKLFLTHSLPPSFSPSLSSIKHARTHRQCTLSVPQSVSMRDYYFNFVDNFAPTPRMILTFDILNLHKLAFLRKMFKKRLLFSV